jgi:predicted MPP superfamily phosphohydrolase
MGPGTTPRPVRGALAAAGSYAVIKPNPTAPWPASLTLRIAVLADIHACDPLMRIERIGGIVEATNALGADLIVLVGDFVADQRFVTRNVSAAEWAPVLAKLTAPLGVYAVLGNHDWRADREAQMRGAGPTIAGTALTDNGIRVLSNEAVPLATRAGPVWLAGLEDQLALVHGRWRFGRKRVGLDDLPATLAAVPNGAPMILLAHEPDIFAKVPARVALTLSGHTHGGQVRLFGWPLVVPSCRRYAYGHVREASDLVVSGGLGLSVAPIRFGVPPEIVVVELGAEAVA